MHAFVQRLSLRLARRAPALVSLFVWAALRQSPTLLPPPPLPVDVLRDLPLEAGRPRPRSLLRRLLQSGASLRDRRRAAEQDEDVEDALDAVEDLDGDAAPPRDLLDGNMLEPRP